MPVAVVAGEPGCVKADDQSGVSQSDLGDQLLEARSLDGARQVNERRRKAGPRPDRLDTSSRR